MQLWMMPVLASWQALWPSVRMPLAFELRPAVKGDLAFCWPIYRDAVQPLMANWNEAEHQRLVEQAVRHPGTSILCSDKADRG